MFRAVLTIAALAGFAAAQTVTLQAEAAGLSGVTVGSSVTGYTGEVSYSRPTLRI
jgi:mannan endo-1,4-beta-mannosidase